MVTPNIIIDPVPRIAGHLRIQAYAEPDGKGGGVITKPGLSASTMVRGIESILKGRDPRDAWAFTPKSVGFGFTEAPRSALGHWVKINQTTGKIDNYQCVVASQWNAGPRDAVNTEGPFPMSGPWSGIGWST